MRLRMYRLMALVFSCLMVAGVIAGCSTATPAATPTPAPQQTTAASEPAAATATPAGPAAPEWQADTSPVNLSAYIDFPQDTFAGWGKDPISTEITKRTGVTLDVKSASTDDSQELNMMLSSNDLPDYIIINWQSPLRQVLWQQEFAQPLNKLIDQHCPTMHQILPKDYEKIYTEADGNFYMLVDYYSDVDRIASLSAVILTYDPFVMNKKMYEQLGSPDVSTLDNYKKMLLDAKTKLTDVPFLVYDASANTPWDDRNMAYWMYRLNGGKNIKAISTDGKIYMGFRDDAYLQGLKFINGLYRDGLFNKENFTVTNDEQYKDLVMNQKIFSFWGQAFNIYRYDMTDNGVYVPYDAPKVDGIVPKYKNNCTAIGGWHGVHISKTSEKPDRAIKYLEFMESDEGQLLMNFGVEGTHWTMQEGLPKRSDETKAAADKDWSSFTKTFGIYNYNIQWLASSYTDSLEYYWAAKTNKMYQGDIAANKYANNERINDLIIVPADSEEKVIETKVNDLWKTSLPKMYLAATEEECVAAYNEFIKQAEGLGLAKLEAAYTKSYQEWNAKLGN